MIILINVNFKFYHCIDVLKIHVMKTPPYSVGSYRAYNVVISSMNCCETIYKFYV